MATIDLANGGTTGFPARVGMQGVGTISVDINIADALTAKGSALAAADVIQAIQLPAGVEVLAAGAEVTTVFAGGLSAVTVDIDVAGGDNIVDGGDCTATGYLAVGTNGSRKPAISLTAADTVDVTIATLAGGALATGVLRVYVTVADISGG